LTPRVEDVMDRGAAPNSSPAVANSAAEVVPPFEWPFVRKVGLVGAGLLAVAVVLGLVATAIDAAPQWPGHSVRLFLVLFGAIAAGAAVSMRPDLWQAWALGAGSALLAVFGTPAHWDSFRMLFGAMTAVAVTWAAILAAPARYRLPVLSVMLLFHFSGIFLATTTPPSTPWVTEQAFLRVYNPYLQFVYLRNAYHFYSPEPGAASVLVFLLKTEVGRDEAGHPKYKTRWVVTPRRPADVKDPLGLTYYRRLSITEQVARGSPGLAMPANYYEKVELIGRRKLVRGAIPLPESYEEQIVQYRLPMPEVARFVIPSYASHVIMENTADTDEARRTTVKMYRLEHSTLGVEEFINWRKNPAINSDPYQPITYRPYFLGEYNARGDLLEPQEPMLYWLVPITPRPGGVPPGDSTKRDFLDYLSFHALGPDGLGMETTVDQLGEKRFEDRVFNWKQLRYGQ
jgi:hypothetical protein